MSTIFISYFSLMKKILLVLMCSLLFVSHSFAYESNKTQKEVPYSNETLGVKFIYPAKYKMSAENNSVNLFSGEQTYFLLNFWEWFDANELYQIAKDTRDSRKSEISNRKDYWYSTVTQLSKVSLGGVDAYLHIQKFPNAKFTTYNYHLYHNGYIVELMVDSRMKGYTEILKNISFFTFQEDTFEDTYYSNDTLWIKFIAPSPNKLITESNASIQVWYDDISYFSILTSKDKKRLGNGLYTYVSSFQKSLKKDEKSFGWDLRFSVSAISKTNIGGEDAYIVEQNFINAGYTKWFYFTEHNKYFFQIEVDSRLGDTMSLSDSLTFY